MQRLISIVTSRPLKTPTEGLILRDAKYAKGKKHFK